MSPERTLEIDGVHDLQIVFRKLLEAFSFPGRLVDLQAQASKLTPWVGGENPTLAAGCAALVDGDAAWAADGDGPLVRFLAEWAGAQPGALETASLVILPRFDNGTLARLLAKVPTGTLADPHRGATVLVGVTNLDEGQPWVLRGPGIETFQKTTLPAGEGWTAVRNDLVHEFPLGLDLAFFDLKGRVVALPRTTRMGD